LTLFPHKTLLARLNSIQWFSDFRDDIPVRIPLLFNLDVEGRYANQQQKKLEEVELGHQKKRKLREEKFAPFFENLGLFLFGILEWNSKMAGGKQRIFYLPSMILPFFPHFGTFHPDSIKPSLAQNVVKGQAIWFIHVKAKQRHIGNTKKNVDGIQIHGDIQKAVQRACMPCPNSSAHHSSNQLTSHHQP
jgi:hypothetical protein